MADGGKTLIIAEKPSVAGDIARALSGMRPVKGQRGVDYYEGDSHIVSSAVGHLLEIAAPEKFEVKRGKWNLQNLPVLPDYFDLKPIDASAARLRVLQKLYRRADVAEVVNACDAGREGELIFHKIMRHFNSGKNGKPVRRLWLSSMTPAAIRSGFEKLRKNADMRPLQDAAVCRDEADWLVGINSTRAMTALHSPAGSFMLTTVGRVQTPTLAILVERERQINAFIRRDYWEVKADFAAAAGEYEGKWQHPPQAKPSAAKSESAAADSSDERPERIFDKALAEKIIAECKNQPGFAAEKKRPQSEQPPMLFDLTSLQRECNMRLHLPARATLAAAQALYERHKMITYPRTDSKALPQDYPPVVAKTIAALQGDFQCGNFAKKILDQKWIQGGNRRVFNNAKVSDHFAIVPTGIIGKGARDIEMKVYRIILRRFLAAFYPAARYEVTERRTLCAGHLFLTRGRILVEAGWREVGGIPKDAALPPLAASKTEAGEGEAVKTLQVESEQKQTAPPPRYNEATLLSAMEGAGKFVDDEELREVMRERGMGTPATRAAIIEGLLRERYLIRDGRDLKPTDKAQALLRLLRALKVDDLTLPEMTGEWERKLRQIESAEFNASDFMEEVRALAARIVEAAKACSDVDGIPGDYAHLSAACPACGGEVHERHRRFSCQNGGCDFFIWKALAGREFSAAEMELLLAGKKTEELGGFRSKKGADFSAAVSLKNEDGKWRAVFEFEGDGDEKLSAEELREKESVGKCPKCGGEVRALGGRFSCDNRDNCDFGMARRMLQREMKAEEIAALLSEGKTAFLDGFISKRTRRPFTARLTMDLQTRDGKLGFEFKPRPFKPSFKSAAKKTAAKKPAAKKPAAKPAKKSAAKKTAAKKTAKPKTARKK